MHNTGFRLARRTSIIIERREKESLPTTVEKSRGFMLFFGSVPPPAIHVWLMMYEDADGDHLH